MDKLSIINLTTFTPEDTAVAKINKIKKEKNSTPNLPVETYLFYSKLGKSEQKGDFSRFFDRLVEIENNLADCMVFLNQKSALQYSRFVQNNHVVLKAYVPDRAIEGRSQGLSLKKGFVTKSHIHGCFPLPAKNVFYIENPHFDKKNYPPFLHAHDECKLLSNTKTCEDVT